MCSGWTPLHEACCKGKDDVVRHLLKAGAITNLQGDTMYTPLHDAAANGHLEVNSACTYICHFSVYYSSYPRKGLYTYFDLCLVL